MRSGSTNIPRPLRSGKAARTDTPAALAEHDVADTGLPRTGMLGRVAQIKGTEPTPYLLEVQEDIVAFETGSVVEPSASKNSKR